MSLTMVFYDKSKSITLVDGITRNAEEIFKELPILRGSRKIVATLNSAGNAVAMDDLDILKSIYKVTEEDDDKALESIKYAIDNPPEVPFENQNVTKGELQAVAQQMSDLELLIMEVNG